MDLLGQEEGVIICTRHTYYLVSLQVGGAYFVRPADLFFLIIFNAKAKLSTRVTPPPPSLSLPAPRDRRTESGGDSGHLSVWQRVDLLQIRVPQTRYSQKFIMSLKRKHILYCGHTEQVCCNVKIQHE